ncbi:MAG: hypothetical protein HY520_04495 [Candidatus Aenigmarchaeota archaeon]|nr:hypothetical protein [Candidatus Aenigmarchaeota archaeon]
MAQESLLLELLGAQPLTRVVDYLLEKRPYDASKQEIIRETGVSRNTFFRIWDRIERFGLVKPTRTIGRATLYVLDDANPVVERLRDLEFTLIKASMEPKKKLHT